MTRQTNLQFPLPPDPTGDALADVYTFLLRKIAERKQQETAQSIIPTTEQRADRNNSIFVPMVQRVEEVAITNAKDYQLAGDHSVRLSDGKVIPSSNIDNRIIA
jgi:hypothetical protein